MTRVRSGEPCRRGQSETIGIVLVFGLVILGASAVVILGAGALGESQDALGVQRAEKAMTQFDSKASLVALGNTDVQSTELVGGSKGTFRTEPGTGWMNVTIKNTTDSSNDFHLVNQSLGSLVYEQRPDVIAYQGGGVWRSTGNGSSMVSPPEFHFRNGTLTLPIVNVTGDPGPAGQAAISHDETIEKFPDSGLSDGDNPLDQHRVILVVRSEFYQGWGEYFEERTDGIVSYDHDKNKATLELVSPLGKKKISAAISSEAAAGALTIQGSSANPCGPGGGLSTPYANSYNSSGTTADYCTQHNNGNTGSAGNITYGEDIDISSGAGGDDIDGSLRSGQTVHVASGAGAGQPRVDGNIYWTDDCQPDPGQCDSRSTGSVHQIGGIATTGNINYLVETKVDDLAVSNDNGAPGVPIDGSDQLDFGGGSTATIDSGGSYFLEEIDIDGGDTLELDTSNGDIVIGVRDYIAVTGGATIDVHGDGIVRLYVKGQNPTTVGGDDHMLHVENGDIDVEHDDSPELRLYGRSDFTASILDGGYTGVIYAPPGEVGTGSLTLNDGGALFGGAIVGDTSIPTGGGQGGSVHYDKALRDTQIISRGARVVKLTYLHVTVNRVEVSGG